MAIYKARSAQPFNKAHFHFDDFENEKQKYLGDVRRQAEELLTKAKAQGDEIKKSLKQKIIDEAKKEIQTLRQQAKEEARQEGLKLGREEAMQLHEKELREKGESFIGLFQKMLEDIRSKSDDLIQGAEKEMLDVSLSIARKIILTESKTNPEVLREQLRRALELVQSKALLEIKVNPEDLERAQKIFPELTQELGQKPQVRWVGDASVSASGCEIQCGDAQVSRDLETQWEKLIQSISASTGTQVEADLAG